MKVKKTTVSYVHSYLHGRRSPPQVKYSRRMLKRKKRDKNVRDDCHLCHFTSSMLCKMWFRIILLTNIELLLPQTTKRHFAHLYFFNANKL